VPGQVHFFPAIANTEDIIKGFEKHNCAKLWGVAIILKRLLHSSQYHGIKASR
jgi:hypothetical protein